MKKLLLTACTILLSVTGAYAEDKVDTGVGEKGIALPSSPAFENGGVPVDMFNIVRAETAKYFAEETILSGGNAMRHERTGIDLDNQTVIRSNFDLIYSYGVYNVSGGITVEVPDYDLYQIVQIFDENHVTLGVVYPGEKVTLGIDDISYGKHVYLFMRTQKRTNDEAGLKELNARQDAVKISAGASAAYQSDVKYDPETFNELRTHLLTTGVKTAKIHEGFIDKISDIVFPHYQVVNLGGWGGLPAKDAFYFVVSPGDDAAKAGKCSSTTFTSPDLQLDRNGYWSLTLYGPEGWVETEPFNTNSLKAKPNKDGSYTLHFNCGSDAINNIEVVENWNGLFRSYLPVSLENILAFKDDFLVNHPVVVTEKK